jgi:predicted PurR-regulated permease PerM
VIFGAVAIWYFMPALLLFFTGVLLAVFLNMPSAWLAEHTPLPTAWALIVVLVVAGGATVLGAWWLAPRLAEQANALTRAIEDSLYQLTGFLGQYGWGNEFLSSMKPGGDLAGSLLSLQTVPRLVTVFSGVFGGIVDVLVVLFLGIYLAASPSRYIGGVVGLLPHKRRERMRQVIASSGEALRRWLLTRMIEMVFVGGSVGIGLWLLQIPLAPILGLITGLLVFIPILGTYLAIVPAALVALTQGPATLLFVLLIYVGAQFIQDYLLAPMLASQIVTIPPVLMLGSQLVFALVGGLLGVAMAVPIAVVVMVWVKLLYIEDVLGDPIELPGKM